MNKLAVMGLALAITGHLSAQSPETRPSFEVASIKPNKSGASQRAMGPEPGGRFGATNVPLRDLMTIAYGIPPYLVDYRISGGPAWVDTEKFDIVAKAESDLPPDQIRMRVRTLLEERFALKVHWETRDLPVFALVLARADGTFGPNFQRSDVDCAAIWNAARGTPVAPQRPNGKPVCTGRTTLGSITGGAMLIDSLVNSLGRFAGRIVENRTGLSGRYDFELTW